MIKDLLKIKTVADSFEIDNAKVLHIFISFAFIPTEIVLVFLLLEIVVSKRKLSLILSTSIGI